MKKILLPALLMSSTFLFAQESMNTAGGEASGPEGSVSYSIGQLAFTEHSSGDGYLSQGIQRAFELLVVADLTVEENITLLSAYPNPVENTLLLEVGNMELEHAQYQLMDSQGNILKSGNLTEEKTSFDFSEYASSVYFINVINVINAQQELKSFKIVKK